MFDTFQLYLSSTLSFSCLVILYIFFTANPKNYFPSAILYIKPTNCTCYPRQWLHWTFNDILITYNNQHVIWMHHVLPYTINVTIRDISSKRKYQFPHSSYGGFFSLPTNRFSGCLSHHIYILIPSTLKGARKKDTYAASGRILLPVLLRQTLGRGSN